MSVEDVVENHKRRHSHWQQQTERCYKCGAFVSKGTPENGVYRYECHRCGVVHEAKKTSLRSLQD